MITGWKKATITTASGTFELNNIAPSICSYNDAPIQQLTFEGTIDIIKQRRSLVIAAYDFDSFADLESDMINHVAVSQVEIEGHQWHIYWKEAATFLVKQRTSLSAGALAVIIISLQIEDDDLSSTIYTTDTLEGS